MLTDEEKTKIKQTIPRKITIAEESVIDALWSEHCSYKSSKRWFHLFNTESPRVVLGIGEGAGLIDVGDDYVIGLGIESHNHPSAVDPFNGAATGVGGIIRDILSQGCKPVAILDCLRFGPPKSSRQRLLLDQVVLGISSYGNCVGIPNVGGDVEFADEFIGNPLVNAMCVGVAHKDDIIRSIAKDPDDLLLLYGSSTGRDGIGGVTFASEDLDDIEDLQQSRGSVQIGDPLTEKLLIDATLELRDKGLLKGLQDLGGGGLACALTEMAEKGQNGMHVDLSKVPIRLPDMQPWEILISESQERMLGIVDPNDIDEAIALLDRYELHSEVIGKVVEGDNLLSYQHEEIATDISVDFVINGFPEPARNLKEDTEKPNYNKPPQSPKDHPLIEMLGSLNLASRKPIYQQYDSTVQGNTIYGPGQDAGIIRLPNGKFLALAAGTNSYMISQDPRVGGSLATLSVVRSVLARGASPIALVDSLNAGNPERKSSYTEFVDMINGVADVSHKFSIPVVGGNVSLYNEAEVEGKIEKILPSAFIGIAGLLDSESDLIAQYLVDTKSKIYMIGPETGFLAGSEYHRRYGGDSDPPEVNFDEELKSATFMESNSKLALSATDVGRGGLLLSLAKWAIRSNVGIEYFYETDDISFEYGEHGARYLIQVDPEQELEFLKECEKYNIDCTLIARRCDEKHVHIRDNIWDLEYLKDLWESPIANALKI